MPFNSLHDFVDRLQRAGELQIVAAQVDPHLEISEISNRAVKAGGPALLFQNVRGSRFPVLTNQFGTRRRMAMAFESASLDEVAARIRRLLDLRIPATLSERLLKLASLAPLRNLIPRTVTNAPCQEVVLESPNLRALPALTTWPLDAGPFITLPLVITKDARSGGYNAGMYRMQIFDERTAAMHWQRHKQGRSHAAGWGDRIPVAVAIGTEPVLTYAASAPLPPVIDEFAFAGLLRRKAVPLVGMQNDRSEGAGRSGVRS